MFLMVNFEIVTPYNCQMIPTETFSLGAMFTWPLLMSTSPFQPPFYQKGTNAALNPFDKCGRNSNIISMENNCHNNKIRHKHAI